MTIREALQLGILKLRLKEWGRGVYLELEQEGDGISDTGILYTPGDSDRVNNIINSRLVGTKIVPVNKRKVKVAPYMWVNRYEEYEVPTVEPPAVLDKLVK